jgi:hypothetical protein
LSLTTYVVSGSTTIAGGATGVASVACNPGDLVLGGGFEGAVEGSGANRVFVIASKPVAPSSWQVEAQNGTNAAKTVTAYAVCADL